MVGVGSLARALDKRKAGSTALFRTHISSTSEFFGAVPTGREDRTHEAQHTLPDSCYPEVWPSVRNNIKLNIVP